MKYRSGEPSIAISTLLLAVQTQHRGLDRKMLRTRLQAWADGGHLGNVFVKDQAIRGHVGLCLIWLSRRQR